MADEQMWHEYKPERCSIKYNGKELSGWKSVDSERANGDKYTVDVGNDGHVVTTTSPGQPIIVRITFQRKSAGLAYLTKMHNNDQTAALDLVDHLDPSANLHGENVKVDFPPFQRDEEEGTTEVRFVCASGVHSAG